MKVKGPSQEPELYSVLPVTQEVNGANNIVHFKISLVNYSDSHSKMISI